MVNLRQYKILMPETVSKKQGMFWQVLSNMLTWSSAQVKLNVTHIYVGRGALQAASCAAGGWPSFSERRWCVCLLLWHFMCLELPLHWNWRRKATTATLASDGCVGKTYNNLILIWGQPLVAVFLFSFLIIMEAGASVKGVNDMNFGAG